MATPLLSLDEITGGQANKHVTHNEALRTLEAVSFRALSITTTAQPASPEPSAGDVYIMPSGATGALWATYAEHDIAIFLDTSWVAVTPFEGLSIYVNDIKQTLRFNGTSWELANRPLLNVEDRNVFPLPTSPIPTAGQAYIVPTASPQTIAADTIAIADGVGGWFYQTPGVGDLVYIVDEQVFSSFNTGSPLGWSSGTAI